MANEKTAPVNVKRLTIFYKEEETEKTLNLTGRLMAYKDTMSSNSEPLSGDGEVQDIAYGYSTGSLELDIHELTGAERAIMYGEKIKNGTNVTTANDNPPYVGVALLVERNDGTVNLHKWFKVKFTPNDESVTQISNGKKTFSTTSIKGIYINDANNSYRASRRQIDPTTEATTVENWFKTASYIGEGSV